jgi:hypothetical protein
VTRSVDVVLLRYPETARTLSRHEPGCRAMKETSTPFASLVRTVVTVFQRPDFFRFCTFTGRSTGPVTLILLSATLG